MVHAAGRDILRRVQQQALQRGLQCAAYVRGMFGTDHDAANREVFLREPVDAPDLVGLAVRGFGKDVQKALKGAPLHD